MPVKQFCLFGLPFGALMAAIAAAGTALTSRPASTADPASPPAPRTVFCVGHVDLEPGVTALLPLRPGRVVEVLAQEGARVDKGDLLLRLDDEQAKLQVAECEAAVKAAEVRVEQTRQAPAQHVTRLAAQRAAIDACEHEIVLRRRELSNTARSDVTDRQSGRPISSEAAERVLMLERMIQQLEARRTVEQEKLKELELIHPDQQVRLVEQKLVAATARLQLARHAQTELSLWAPADGTIFRVLVGVGDMVGHRPDRAAVLFCPAGPRIVRAEIEQEFAAPIAPGQRVLLQDDARPGDTWSGRVQRVSDWYARRRETVHETVRYQDVRTVECIIELVSPPATLRIGQRLQAVIELQPEPAAPPAP